MRSWIKTGLLTLIIIGCGCITPQQTAAPIPAASAPTDQTSAPQTLVDTKTAFEEQSTGDSDVETPVVIEEPAPSLTMSDGQPWIPPTYTGQDAALGYVPEDFSITTSMKDRVQFWVDVYSKYTSNQGVLHDSQYINLIYSEIDFGDITKDTAMTDRQKYRARQKAVKERKQEVIERLKRLHQISDPTTLEGEDLRVWNMFKDIPDKDKFLEAASKNRLRFQLGQRDFFIKGIYFSGRYIKEMEQIFKEEGLPLELTRLPFVESSFNIYARSKVGASGIWQFMRGTARHYMKVSPYVDERNDPLTATRAAARLLKSNYRLLESWPLAITAYNHGPNGLMRLVKKFGTRNIKEIIDTAEGRRFGFASKNFYASFLAAVEVESKAEKYFGRVVRAPDKQYEALKLDKPVSYKTLVASFGGDATLAEMYNAHLTRLVRNGHARIPAGTQVRLLVNKKEGFLELAKTEPALQRGGRGSRIDKDTQYKVVRGDTISGIASMFGVPPRAIIEVNDVDPRRLRPGQRLVIPAMRD